jgi:hypothetical protein
MRVSCDQQLGAIALNGVSVGFDVDGVRLARVLREKLLAAG